MITTVFSTRSATAILLMAACGCGPNVDSEGTQTTTGSTVSTSTSTGNTSVTSTETTSKTTASTTMTTPIDTSNLYGSAPKKAFPAPEFVVLSHTNETRTREDLLGHPTVVWFFPFAGTPG